MTVLRASANASSLRRRSSADNDEWETKVSTPSSRSSNASCSFLRRDSQKTSLFSP